MDVVILAGGGGTRLREMTEFMPKALIPIGGRPILYHIMKIYAHHGHTDFILALGYKQEAFKEYFNHFDDINNDCVIHVGRYRGTTCRESPDNWKVTLSDTGINSDKSARLRMIEKYIKGDTFMVTYGDGIADIKINALLAYHESKGRIATVTGIHPQARFGEIHHDDGLVTSFSEKPHDGQLVNGGFFVFNREIFKYLEGDLETHVLEKLTQIGQLAVYQHDGYWGCLDTIKDMDDLNRLWDSGKAKWRVW